MKYFQFFSTCVLALALHSTAWAEIYESTDAQGNPEFSDTPAGPDSEVVDLQQTNIIAAPQMEPQEEAPPPAEEYGDQEEPEQENRTVIIHDGNDNEDEVYDDYRRRERAFNRMDPAAPDEVLDAEAPREVGDYDSQMPREVGDSDSQMPREVGDSDAQMPHEVGDFPVRGGAAHRR